MGVPGNANALLLVQAAAAGGYTIDRSLRFNSADSAYLNRTPASAGNRKTWTWAGWVKRSALGLDQTIFRANNSSIARETIIYFTTSNTIGFYEYSSGFPAFLQTTQVFRDTSAWYHIVAVWDTDNATSGNRMRLYVNGVEVTALATDTQPSLGLESTINTATVHTLGAADASNNLFNGYLADIHFIDGQALDPTSFGEFDTNGVWQPLEYTGSYGTNGFHLDFADNSSAAALGYDAAGSNDWTVNNLIVTDGTVSVAGATGGLPIYNTTDTYGTVKGTGTRTDSSSASIVLALPMDGTNNGTTFTDESATIKGSGSAKTLTRNGDTKTVTSQSKFYGSSGYFDGTGDYLSDSNADYAFGTGDFTIECWVYVDSIAEQNFVATRGTAGSTTAWSFAIGSTGTLYLYSNAMIATSSVSLVAQQWTHVAASRSGTTCRLFVNGVQVGSGSNSQNFSTQTLGIGSAADGTQFPLTGNMQDVRVYKGTAKYTSNFNPPSSTANATLAAGNDSLRDSPTNGDTANDTGLGGEVPGNYCTWNPVNSGGSGTPTITNGNLDFSLAASVGAIGTYTMGTIAVTTGKHYWEVTGTSLASNAIMIGLMRGADHNTYGDSTGVIYYGFNGNKAVDGTFTSYGATYTNNDVIGVALDLDAGTVTFYKNNSSQGSISLPSSTSGWKPYVGNGTSGGSQVGYANFGQRPFAYTAPSGFKALCTTNLPTPTIADGSTAMDVKLWTGNSGTQTISGLGFSPDLVWVKRRNSTAWHFLFDTIRGTNKALFSNDTLNEVNYGSGYLDAFTSDGFTLGSNGDVNGTGGTFVAWTWDGGSSTVTNNDGSISSQVRANASAGFSIVTYTGNGTAGATVGHGLGVASQFIVIKQRNTAGASATDWWVYHASLGATKGLNLNTTSAATTSTSLWNDTAPTSSVFTLGSGSERNYNTGTYVAYCFAPVAGYSAFGSYTGTGASPNFVHLGFRPKLLIIKNASAGNNWLIQDSRRFAYNLVSDTLYPNTSSLEASSASNFGVDFLSNGFALRTTGSYLTNSNNASEGHTYIYAAFAEHPFQTARAR